MFLDETKFDKVNFEKELTELAKQTRELESKDDLEHLRQIVNWTNFFGFMGLATFWYSVSIVPIVCILAPLMCYVLDHFSPQLFGEYKFGNEILIINGTLTFLMLYILIIIEQV